ncbi:MAG: sugar phosphate isomerase/epimerase [Lentisphaerae bacterium]|jgi:sugar phosphate isomerase/epimerase|nr:sugar phosphate isomerase/epimerase [Lentisphaerota bacterium]
MKLATTTGDFRLSIDKKPECIALFKGTGFRHLDLNLYKAIYPDSPFLDDRWDRWVGEVAESAAANGMSFCQAHSPYGNQFSTGEEYEVFLMATIRSIETCGRLGIPQTVVHGRDIGGYPSREYRDLNLQRNLDFFSCLFPAMEKTGVRVLIENSCDRHAPTRENSRHYLSTAAEVVEMVEYVNHPLIGACWDTGHANVQGVDQYRSIVELGGHLKGLHINDNYGDMDSHVAPFQGTTNMDSIMQGLQDSHYGGYFTFEAGNILRDGGVWPNYRREWEFRGEKVTRLMNVPLEIKQQAIALLYQLGKHMLTEYGCFEE